MWGKFHFYLQPGSRFLGKRQRVCFFKWLIGSGLVSSFILTEHHPMGIYINRLQSRTLPSGKREQPSWKFSIQTQLMTINMHNSIKPNTYEGKIQYRTHYLSYNIKLTQLSRWCLTNAAWKWKTFCSKSVENILLRLWNPSLSSAKSSFSDSSTVKFYIHIHVLQN